MDKIILNVTDMIQHDEFLGDISIDGAIRGAIQDAIEAYCDDCEERGYFISRNRWVDWACKENFFKLYFKCKVAEPFCIRESKLVDMLIDISNVFDCGAYLCRRYNGNIPREVIFTDDSCPELCEFCGLEPDELPDFLGAADGWIDDLNWPEGYKAPSWIKDIGCIGRNVIFWDAIFKYIDRAPQLVNAVIYCKDRDGCPINFGLSEEEWYKETYAGILEILRKDN